MDLNVASEWAQIISVMLIPVGALWAYLRNRENRQNARLTAMEKRQIQQAADIAAIKTQFVNNGNGSLRTAIDTLVDTVRGIDSKVDDLSGQVNYQQGQFDQHMKENPR